MPPRSLAASACAPSFHAGVERSSRLGSAAASFSSTLRTLSSMLCGRSIRVPNRRVDEIRGVPIACTTSWQRLMAANTSSHSPSMLVPYACSLVFRPASASTRSQAATSLETDTPTPIGIKHRSAMTRIITFQSYCPSIVRLVPAAAGIAGHHDRLASCAERDRSTCPVLTLRDQGRWLYRPRPGCDLVHPGVGPRQAAAGPPRRFPNPAISLDRLVGSRRTTQVWGFCPSAATALRAIKRQPLAVASFSRA